MQVKHEIKALRLWRLDVMHRSQKNLPIFHYEPIWHDISFLHRPILFTIGTSIIDDAAKPSKLAVGVM
jgi:hypothetical protein